LYGIDMSTITAPPAANICGDGSNLFGSKLFRMTLQLLPHDTLYGTLPTLAFRLSQDGAGGAAAFHRMCDGLGKTVRKR
jgi:hypothetical protein